MRRGEYMEWEPPSRIEELEDVYDDNYSNAPVRPSSRMRGDKMHMVRHEFGGGAGPERQYSYQDDLAYGDDFSPEDEGDYIYEEELRIQAAMRRKEEALVDRALRRMNRARLRGDGEIALSREEIDALERRQLLPRMQQSPIPSPPLPQAQVSPPSLQAQASPSAKSKANTTTASQSNKVVLAPKPKKKPSATGAALKSSAKNSKSRNSSSTDLNVQPTTQMQSASYPIPAGVPLEQMVPIPMAYFGQPQPMPYAPTPQMQGTYGYNMSPGKTRSMRAASGPSSLRHHQYPQQGIPDPRDFRPSSSSSYQSGVEPDMYSSGVRSRSDSAARHGYPSSSQQQEQHSPTSVPTPPSSRRHAVSYPAGYRTPPRYSGSAERLHQYGSGNNGGGGSNLAQEIIVISDSDSSSSDRSYGSDHHVYANERRRGSYSDDEQDEEEEESDEGVTLGGGQGHRHVRSSRAANSSPTTAVSGSAAARPPSRVQGKSSTRTGTGNGGSTRKAKR